MHMPSIVTDLSPALRIVLIVTIAAAAHLLVRLARTGVGRLLSTPRRGHRTADDTLRLWPGRQGTVEPLVRQRILAALRQRAPDYHDWMLRVTNRVA